MYFFSFNLEKFTPDRIFYTGSARNVRDKYEVYICHECRLHCRGKQIKNAISTNLKIWNVRLAVSSILSTWQSECKENSSQLGDREQLKNREFPLSVNWAFPIHSTKEAANEFCALSICLKVSHRQQIILSQEPRTCWA